MLHSKLTLIAAALALWTTNVRADIESIRAKAQALDKRAQQIMELSEGLKKQVETTGQQVQEKVEKIKALRENLDQLTDDAKRRAELLKSGEEAKQLESLKGAEGLGDEAILLAGTAAKGSKHTKVRRKAIDLAVSLGSEGYAALAFSFESLAAEDRTYAVEQLAKGGAANLVILVAAAREADLSTRAALFKAGAAIGGEQGLLLIVAASKDLDAKLAEDFASVRSWCELLAKSAATTRNSSWIAHSRIRMRHCVRPRRKA
ncbi:MAG: hypothetical protein HY000_02295 [Planctomycetes bacterium]|nr:hypothetical protein [Planctomycetota bacterium]